MVPMRGKLWHAINTNCGFINFHPRGFWTGTGQQRCQAWRSAKRRFSVSHVYQLRSMTYQGRSRLFRERTRGTVNNYPAASCGPERSLYSVKTDSDNCVLLKHIYATCMHIPCTPVAWKIGNLLPVTNTSRSAQYQLTELVSINQC